MYVDTYTRIMGKTKLTLSVDSDLLKSAKIQLLKKGITLSDYTEEAMRSLVTASIIEDIARTLDIKLSYMSFEDVNSKRVKAPKGQDSASVIREIRDDRADRISGF